VSEDRRRASASASLRAYPRLGRVYDLITGDEDARVCKDIPEASCRHLPRNFFAYLLANLLTKIADELASARLVLPWLLGSVGAPAAFTGFLVPIREAGVLLPQLAVAAYVRRLARRKGVWLVGALLSALALGLMAATVGRLQGAAAGWSVVLALTLFSLARGLCSVSAKDVLGKTVSKTRRGALMGYSAATAGVATLALGLYIKLFAAGSQDLGLFVVLLGLATVIWLVAFLVFSAIREEPGATEGGGNAFQVAMQSMGLLRSDRDFRRFVIARSLLLSVALAPPFFVLLAQQRTEGLAGLGLLIIASGLAASLSSPLWGRMGDRSSRRVMVIAAAGAALLGVVSWLLDQAAPDLMKLSWVHGILFLCIAVFHSGVRLGRKVYLVDMATSDNRSTFVAVSNTVVGGVMLVGGLFGVLGDLLQPSGVIALLGLLSGGAALYIARLPDVSG
jgi:MFS family permease